jgi:hypothetical protein
MPRRDLRLLLGLIVLALAWGVLQSLSGYDAGWTFLMPAVLVALPLLAGRYLGEDAIVRLGLRTRPRRAARAPRVEGRSLAPRRLLHRGGALVASSLAVRPPPAALA